MNIIKKSIVLEYVLEQIVYVNMYLMVLGDSEHRIIEARVMYVCMYNCIFRLG